MVYNNNDFTKKSYIFIQIMHMEPGKSGKLLMQKELKDLQSIQYYLGVCSKIHKAFYMPEITAFTNQLMHNVGLIDISPLFSLNNT